MTHLAEFLAVFGLLLAWEGCAWTRRGALAFRGIRPGAARPAWPSAAFGTPSAGFLLRRLLPFGEAHPVEEWPLSVSPDGVLGATALGTHPDGRAPQSARFVAFDAAPRFWSDGTEVLEGGTRFARTQSPVLARRLAGLLTRLAGLAPEERAVAITQELSLRFDVDACAARIAAGRAAARRLMLPSLGLVALAFGALPAAHVTFGLRPAGPFLGAAFIALVTWIVLAFRSAHVLLLPAEDALRRRDMLLCVCVPTLAMRSREALDEHLLAAFHPATAAAVLCRPEVLANFLGLALRDALEPERPACEGEDARAVATEAWQRERVVERLSALAAARGLERARLLTPTPADGEAASSWCPRCLAVWRVRNATCTDCGGSMPALAGWR